MPFDCGSPRTGLGARQRGSEWQRGKGCAPPAPAASRIRSPPRAGAAATAAATAAAAVAAAAPAHRQSAGKRAAPAGRAKRAQQVVPAQVRALGRPASDPCPGPIWVCSAERNAQPWRRPDLVDSTEPTAGEWPEKGLGAHVPLSAVNQILLHFLGSPALRREAATFLPLFWEERALPSPQSG